MAVLVVLLVGGLMLVAFRVLVPFIKALLVVLLVGGLMLVAFRVLVPFMKALLRLH
jgi:hypothetical protein